jgi:hypothetical protein
MTASDAVALTTGEVALNRGTDLVGVRLEVAAGIGLALVNGDCL